MTIRNSIQNVRELQVEILARSMSRVSTRWSLWPQSLIDTVANRPRHDSLDRRESRQYRSGLDRSIRNRR